MILEVVRADPIYRRLMTILDIDSVSDLSFGLPAPISNSDQSTNNWFWAEGDHGAGGGEAWRPGFRKG